MEENGLKKRAKTMGIRRERESEMMSCLEEEEEGQVKNNNAPMLKFGI